MVFTALPPPPPTPITLIRAVKFVCSTISIIHVPPSKKIDRFHFSSKKFVQPIGHTMAKFGQQAVVAYAKWAAVLARHAVQHQADAGGVHWAGDHIHQAADVGRHTE